MTRYIGPLLAASLLLIAGGFRVAAYLPRALHEDAVVPAPRALAALPGAWEGTWEEVLPTTLSVEQPSAGVAVLNYTWEDYDAGPFAHGLRNLWTKIAQDGTFTWSYFADYRFGLSENATHLVGTRRLAGKLARIEMRRVPGDLHAAQAHATHGAAPRRSP